MLPETTSDITLKTVGNTDLKIEKNAYLKWFFLGILMMGIGWLLGSLLFPTPKTPPIFNPKKGAYPLTYQGVNFDIYNVPMVQNGLKLLSVDNQRVPFRDVKTLKSYLENRRQKLVFAMNAGMYTTENLPKGVYIEQKRTIFPLDTAQSGFGNFYLQPNGVFAFDDTSAVVLDTQIFQKQLKNYNYATQSGPLLVINNAINPVFTPDSKSLYIRNGVGITQGGKIVFVISNQPVNFYLFAQLFRDELHCPNALFLDGAISKMYAPEINRFDVNGDLGPFVVLVK